LHFDESVVTWLTLVAKFAALTSDTVSHLGSPDVASLVGPGGAEFWIFPAAPTLTSAVFPGSAVVELSGSSSTPGS